MYQQSFVNVIFESETGETINLERQQMYTDYNNNIYYNHWLNSQSEDRIFIRESTIYLKDVSTSEFINIGNYPFGQDLFIASQEFNCLHFQYILASNFNIKNQRTIVRNQQRITTSQESTLYSKNSDSQKNQNANQYKRAAEKYIYEVQQAIIRWRNLIENQKMNLNDASDVIGWPRQSLDDYFLQFNKGKQFNFDFARFKHLKMGVLRKFNKNEGVDENFKIAAIPVTENILSTNIQTVQSSTNNYCNNQRIEIAAAPVEERVFNYQRQSSLEEVMDIEGGCEPSYIDMDNLNLTQNTSLNFNNFEEGKENVFQQGQELFNNEIINNLQNYDIQGELELELEGNENLPVIDEYYYDRLIYQASSLNNSIEHENNFDDNQYFYNYN